MRRDLRINHEFVDAIPAQLSEKVLYVCIPFATVAHRCFCGCGSEVVTPLARTDWKLTYDGESVSLNPSIGSWNLPCKSHYWVERDTVRWARLWSEREIGEVRAQDHRDKDAYFSGTKSVANKRGKSGGPDARPGPATGPGK